MRGVLLVPLDEQTGAFPKAAQAGLTKDKGATPKADAAPESPATETATA